MRSFRINSIFLFLLLTLPSTMPCWGQTPAPALQTQFLLPLADASTASAILLPTLDNQAFLVYTTPIGKLGLYLLTPQTQPIPPTPIPPQPIPPAPIPQKLSIAIVENPLQTTQEQRTVLADPRWRKLVTDKHTLIGIIPTDVIEKGTGKPPALLVPFLDHAKGKTLPWVVFTDASGVILWEGPLPPIGAELESLIRHYGG